MNFECGAKSDCKCTDYYCISCLSMLHNMKRDIASDKAKDKIVKFMREDREKNILIDCFIKYTRKGRLCGPSSFRYRFLDSCVCSYEDSAAMEGQPETGTH